MGSILGSLPVTLFIPSIFKEPDEDWGQTSSCILGRHYSAFTSFERLGADQCWNRCPTPRFHVSRLTIVHSALLPCRNSAGSAGQEREASRGALSDLLQEFVRLLEVPRSSGQDTARAGNEMLSRLSQAASKLQGDQQVIFEILRVIRLLQMDMALVGAARKDSTLNERLQTAKAHALQASQLMTML